MQPIWAVGLMTGTVLDGNIDVAMLKTDGERIETFGAYTLAPYPPVDPRHCSRRRWRKRANGTSRAPTGDLSRSRGGADARPIGGGEGAGRERRASRMADIGVVGFHGQSRAASRAAAGPHRRHAPARRRRADA